LSLAAPLLNVIWSNLWRGYHPVMPGLGGWDDAGLSPGLPGLMRQGRKILTFFESSIYLGSFLILRRPIPSVAITVIGIHDILYKHL